MNTGNDEDNIAASNVPRLLTDEDIQKIAPFAYEMWKKPRILAIYGFCGAVLVTLALWAYSVTPSKHTTPLDWGDIQIIFPLAFVCTTACFYGYSAYKMWFFRAPGTCLVTGVIEEQGKSFRGFVEVRVSYIFQDNRYEVVQSTERSREEDIGAGRTVGVIVNPRYPGQGWVIWDVRGAA